MGRYIAEAQTINSSLDGYIARLSNLKTNKIIKEYDNNDTVMSYSYSALENTYFEIGETISILNKIKTQIEERAEELDIEEQRKNEDQE